MYPTTSGRLWRPPGVAAHVSVRPCRYGGPTTGRSTRELAERRKSAGLLGWITRRTNRCRPSTAWLVPPAFGRLGPPASLAWVYEPVPGCSRRPFPGDEDAATEPRERTLTDSRRRSPASSWSMSHVALDAAVATAYGGL